MFDDWYDWPSKGAAVSLLQYSHTSLTDADIYYKLVWEENFPEKCSEFILICPLPEIKKFLHESVGLIEISKNKYSSIESLLA